MKALTKAVLVLCFFVSGAFSVSVNASDNSTSKLAQPTGRVVLTISGNISHFNSEKSEGAMPIAALDLAMIEALQSEQFATTTPWTQGNTVFEGARLNDLLALVGARSNQLTLVGLDGYSAETNTVDFDRYPVIVSYKVDEKYMTVRSLGPLWLMFPFDPHPELLTEANKAASVWQLVSIVVH